MWISRFISGISTKQTIHRLLEGSKSGSGGHATPTTHSRSDLSSAAAAERLLDGVHLLEDARAALVGDGRRGAEADVVPGHGVERRVHVPERLPPQQRLLAPVLGHPRVGQLPELRHGVRHLGVRLVHADRRAHLPDHLLGLARVLVVRCRARLRRHRRPAQQQRRSEAAAGEDVAPARCCLRRDAVVGARRGEGLRHGRR